MSLGLLGDGFDLHGGGQDLAFPHHENERAQAVAEDRPFAQHWMHNGWVEVEGTKMSKSLGNFTSLTDLLSQVDGRAYRILVLRAYYRSPIGGRWQLADAEKALERLDALARRFALPDLLEQSEHGYVVLGEGGAVDIDETALTAFRKRRMDDDMDTPGALAGIFELVSAANSAADTNAEARAEKLARTAAVLAAALGLAVRGGAAEVDEAAAKLVAERDEARKNKDFARAGTVAADCWRSAGPSRTRRRGRRSGASGPASAATVQVRGGYTGCVDRDRRVGYCVVTEEHGGDGSVRDAPRPLRRGSSVADRTGTRAGSDKEAARCPTSRST